MKICVRDLIIFFSVYISSIASIWGVTEAYTYFTEDKLREFLGRWWLIVYYILPLIISIGITLITHQNNRKKNLSREELQIFTLNSVDPVPRGVISRPFHNTEISDNELRKRIIERNKSGKPTYLLRMEYDRRLKQRGL